GGWTASVNGVPLAQVPSPAGSWAQAFRLPSGGGTLSIGHPNLEHDLMLIFELVGLLVVVALALPGIRVAGQYALSGYPGDAERVGTAGSATAEAAADGTAVAPLAGAA